MLFRSAEALVGDDALDLGGLVEGLVALLDLAADNVLGDIVLLAESESLSDLASPLGTESARLLVISEASNLTGALLENLEGKDAKVGAGDAASDGLTLALASSFGAVRLDSLSEQNSNSAVDKDTLLHRETLLVVTAGDSEGVALELVAEDLAVDVGAHPPVVEVTVDLVFIDLPDDLLAGGGVGNVVLQIGRAHV